ncbi:MAG: hypothetical protein ACFFD3_03990, partial [Candidatus Thorarchaeota archaeon]
LCSLGLFLAILATRYAYPWLIASIFKLERKELENLCRITPRMVFSCLIGLLFHVLVDYLHHWYNPIFWPWIDPFALVGPLVSLTSIIVSVDIQTGYFIANAFTNAIMLIVLIQIVLSNKEDRWRKLWIGS